MPQQHSTEEEANQDQGIVVPLELEGVRKGLGRGSKRISSSREMW